LVLLAKRVDDDRLDAIQPTALISLHCFQSGDP
jgi:hypothetical protein